MEVIIMKERLKQARIALRLSQRNFGSRIGVTDAAISKLESGFNNLTEQMILSICREFGINENWLRTGEGEMLNETRDDFLRSLSEKHGLSPLIEKTLETYLSLDGAALAAVDAWLDAIAAAVASGRPVDLAAIIERTAAADAQSGEAPPPAPQDDLEARAEAYAAEAAERAKADFLRREKKAI